MRIMDICFSSLRHSFSSIPFFSLANFNNSNQAANNRDHFSGNKFITPMVANEKVYVGTPNSVAVFGLLP